MLKNNFKLAFRSLFRQKGYSVINIAGLSISLAVTLLMLLWVQDEWSTNKFHENGDRIFYVKRTIPQEGDKLAVYPSIPYPVIAAAEKELPEVEKYMPMGFSFQENVVRGEQAFRAAGSFGNMAYFESFSYPILQGDISGLDEEVPNVAISESLAKKFFGNLWTSNAIGEAIEISDAGAFNIIAIFKDFPENSSIQLDYVQSFTNHLSKNDWMKEWSNTGMQGTILLAEGADPVTVGEKIERLFQDKQEAERKEGILLQRYADDYLYGQFNEQAQVAGGRIEYVQMFGIAALLLLLISCINFVNLATARASKRAKEVGVRKTIGAGKLALIKQFMAEAFVITITSVGLAILLAETLLPNVRLITEKMLDFDYTQTTFWLSMMTVIVLTTLLSGAYPSFI
ncbi:MAG: ABC transporter permease, partial [Bacteroidota bacterium]